MGKEKMTEVWAQAPLLHRCMLTQLGIDTPDGLAEGGCEGVRKWLHNGHRPWLPGGNSQWHKNRKEEHLESTARVRNVELTSEELVKQQRDSDRCVANLQS